MVTKFLRCEFTSIWLYCVAFYCSDPLPLVVILAKQGAGKQKVASASKKRVRRNGWGHRKGSGYSLRYCFWASP